MLVGKAARHGKVPPSQVNTEECPEFLQPLSNQRARVPLYGKVGDLHRSARAQVYVALEVVDDCHTICWLVIPSYVYIYLYRERERDLSLSLSLSLYIYIIAHINKSKQASLFAAGKNNRFGIATRLQLHLRSVACSTRRSRHALMCLSSLIVTASVRAVLHVCLQHASGMLSTGAESHVNVGSHCRGDLNSVRKQPPTSRLTHVTSRHYRPPASLPTRLPATPRARRPCPARLRAGHYS